MIDFHAYAEKYSTSVPSALGIAFAIVLASLVARTVRLRRELRSAPTALASWDPGQLIAVPPICAFASRFLLSQARVELEEWPEGRLFASREAADILEEYVERRLSTIRFAVGSTATGIALFCTFYLISHVLEANIPNALDAASGATANTEQLKIAMRLLGQKFLISATGIGIAVLFAMTTAIARRVALDAAHDASAQVVGLFCTPASLSASVQLLQLRATHASSSHLDEIRATMHATREDLARLGSIEVSVKDMGAEVTTQLQRMLKEDLGNEIKEILKDVMRQADEIAERLRSNLIESIQRAIETEVPKVLESLQGIRQSVEGQASSPLEKILEQLKSVVSGGMQGESSQMSAALRQFAEVVPALALQLKDVAHSMTTDMRDRTNESARVTESLLAQVGGLLARLESQQSATEQAIAQIARASTVGAEAMMARLEAGSAEVMGGLLKTSRAEIDGVLEKLQAVATQSAQGYGTMEQSLGATARTIAEVRDGLADAAESIRSISTETRGVVSGARQSSEAAQRAASSFENAAGMLSTGVDSMRAAIDQGRSYGTEQQAVVAEHRKLLEELEKMWPRLFETYLRSFDEKSTLLARSWTDLYTQVSKLSETVGGGLSEAAEDLKVSVDRLTATRNGSSA